MIKGLGPRYEFRALEVDSFGVFRVGLVRIVIAPIRQRYALDDTARSRPGLGVALIDIGVAPARGVGRLVGAFVVIFAVAFAVAFVGVVGEFVGEVGPSAEGFVVGPVGKFVGGVALSVAGPLIGKVVGEFVGLSVLG
jgi:hypothetical protein